MNKLKNKTIRQFNNNYLYLMLLIVLAGTALRFYNLTYHSLWFDETISVRWAKSSVDKILEVSMNLVEDRLPPLYYLLLKWWGDIAGLSEFSIRYPSVIFGVLLIPVVYVIGCRLFRPSVGIFGAVLVAFNPFLIWYSQEARMYALAVLLASFGVLCFIKAVNLASPNLTQREGIERGQIVWWIGLGLAALAGLYTHLYTGFLWPALALWLLIHPNYFKRVWLYFGLTMATVSLLFLPLALANWRFSGESLAGNPLNNINERIIFLFEAFILWQSALSPERAIVFKLILGLFLILGITLALWKPTGRLLILLLIMPFIIASILLLRSQLAFFGQRYFIIMVPWMLLLIALVPSVGVKKLVAYSSPFYFQLKSIKITSFHLERIIYALSIGVIGLATVYPVSFLWTVPATKEAWRQTVTYMTTHVQPEDAVLIHPEWVRFSYQYYEGLLKAPGHTYAVFSAVDQNTDLNAPLTGVVGEHPVVWLIQSHFEQPDPDRRVENWFAVRYPLVTELYPPGVVLKAYAPGYQLNQLPSTATPTQINFQSGLQLQGFHLYNTHLSPRENLFHPPSNWIHITLYWSINSDQELTYNEAPYVHLTDEKGQIWGASLERGNDAIHLYPPSRWQAEQIIRHDMDVNLNPIAPAGQYNLVLGINNEQFFLNSIWLEDSE